MECVDSFKALTARPHVQDASPTANRGRAGMAIDSRPRTSKSLPNLYKLQLCLATLVILGRARVLKLRFGGHGTCSLLIELVGRLYPVVC